MELERIQVSWNTNFTMVPNELWDIEDLSHEGFRIFTYLIRLGANKEGAIFPSYPTIANKCQITNSKGEYCKTKTRRIIEELIKRGLVKKFNRKKKGTSKFGSNLYILTHPKELLNVVKTVAKEEYDIIIDTPCVIPEKGDSKEPNEIKWIESDTPVSPIKTVSTEPKTKKSDTYIDLLNNTSLNKDDDRSIGEESEDKKEQRELLEECYELISKATGLNLERVKMCIAPNLLWKVDLEELIGAFDKSKYLKGLADKKVPISTFGSVMQLNKVIGGFYEDRPEAKGKGGGGKPPKGPCVMKHQGQDHSEIVEDIQGNMTDLERLKSEITKKILKSGHVKLMANLTPLKTLDQIQEFIQRYDL